MDLSKWRPCTSSENKLLDTYNFADFPGNSKYGGLYLDRNGAETQEIDMPDDEKPVDQDLRDKFPETWIWGTSETTDGLGSISATVPDSMTTWLITGFTVNKEFGFALAKPQELIVSQEFFVELNLPYTLRFGEILKLEVIVFNFLRQEFAGNITATLKVFSIDKRANDVDDEEQFEFLEFLEASSSCKTRRIQSTTVTKSLIVPHRTGTRYITYIRPLKNKMIKIRAEASVTIGGRTFIDKISKEIVVENEGIAFYDVQNHEFLFDVNKKESINIRFKANDTVESAIELTVVVAGDMMGPSINFSQSAL